jgi:hypothetical protein
MANLPVCINGSPILERWMGGGPTGEAMRYRTADGRVWQDDLGPVQAITGLTYGQFTPGGGGTGPGSGRGPGRAGRPCPW